jgi:hypothetical protein
LASEVETWPNDSWSAAFWRRRRRKTRGFPISDLVARELIKKSFETT